MRRPSKDVAMLVSTRSTAVTDRRLVARASRITAIASSALSRIAWIFLLRSSSVIPPQLSVVETTGQRSQILHHRTFAPSDAPFAPIAPLAPFAPPGSPLDAVVLEHLRRQIERIRDLHVRDLPVGAG